MREKNTSVDDYLLHLNGELAPQLKKVEQQLAEDDLLGINIGRTEGTILSFLVQAFNVRSILEIGTQYGYSTLWFLENLPENGRLVSIEKNEVHFNKASLNIQDKRCHLICGDAQKVLFEDLANDSFDLIFIDANKKAYPRYLHYAKDHVRSGGLIIGDNTFLMNSVFESAPVLPKIDTKLVEAMREFNRNLFSDPRFVSCILPTSEGLTIGYKKK